VSGAPLLFKNNSLPEFNNPPLCFSQFMLRFGSKLDWLKCSETSIAADQDLHAGQEAIDPVIFNLEIPLPLT
jgi:hypothetical protein